MAAGVFTFARFFPKINARYDYGLLIFTLTFVLISVSGYQDNEILELAYKRLSTILLGSFTCIIVSIMMITLKWLIPNKINPSYSDIKLFLILKIMKMHWQKQKFQVNQRDMVKMSLESGKALKELALSIKTMVKPFPADIHIQNSKSAAKSLNSLLKSSVGLWDDNMDLRELYQWPL
ncbi:hypothetical protein Goklo_003016 [Gossypium klotzschianum]|uniref:Aluminum-activated malate transporter n=1 Tax=Gossypium klotzschianum TaxID=34286 RepID=A0A7J8VV04_9ROSI|nr:hypothetical protein [Gossypium klotzschianum]